MAEIVNVTFQQQLRQLKTGDEAAQLAAVDRLCRLPSWEARLALAEALQGSTFNTVRQAAARALVEQPNPPDTPWLYRMFMKDPLEHRQQAATYLLESDDVEGVELVCRHLDRLHAPGDWLQALDFRATTAQLPALCLAFRHDEPSDESSFVSIVTGAIQRLAPDADRTILDRACEILRQHLLEDTRHSRYVHDVLRVLETALFGNLPRVVSDGLRADPLLPYPAPERFAPQSVTLPEFAAARTFRPSPHPHEWQLLPLPWLSCLSAALGYTFVFALPALKWNPSQQDYLAVCVAVLCFWIVAITAATIWTRSGFPQAWRECLTLRDRTLTIRVQPGPLRRLGYTQRFHLRPGVRVSVIEHTTKKGLLRPHLAILTVDNRVARFGYSCGAMERAELAERINADLEALDAATPDHPQPTNHPPQ